MMARGSGEERQSERFISYVAHPTRDEDPTFISLDPDPAKLKMKKPAPDPTFIRNEEKKYLYFR